MKKNFLSYLILSITAGVICISCKKEYSCEGCKENNKPPIAVAGPDQVITLPTDSISLDGTASSDPDGTISEWLWTKISGPASFNMIKPNDSTTLVKNLTIGAYQFELKVTDNAGLSAKDTVRIIVNNGSQPNRPPVANAGPDQTITLPTNAITVNGSGSTDPENNITSYVWTKISGPSSLSIANANAVQTQVTNLIEGIYLFELKVTDAGNLFSKDTMLVSLIIPCNNNNWPVLNASLVQIGNLSEPRSPGAGSAGSKVVFAGGWRQAVSRFSCGEFTVGSAVVDIYDVNTSSWQTHQLSKARLIGASINANNKIFFAGGTSWVIQSNGEWDESYDNVDIYNASSNTWEIAHLSKARQNMAVAVLGNKVFFAGGLFYTGNFLPAQIWDVSNVVDVYDLSTNSWSVYALSLARSEVKAVVVDNTIYFIGGVGYGSGTNYSNLVDIYDNNTNSWSTSDLQTVIATLSPPPGMGVIDSFEVAGDNIIFWSGQNQVGIRNLTTGTSFISCVSHPMPVFFINNSIVFFDGRSQFEIYNPTTGVWSIGVSNPPIPPNTTYSVIQLNNSLYLGGGWSGTNGGVCIFSDKVYKLSW